MSRTVIDVVSVKLALAGRRTELAHQLEHDPAAGGTIDRLAELEEIDGRLTASIAEHGRRDVTKTSRPGVLLVGAGIRGDVTVRADDELVNVELLSDRDLAVFAALADFVAERLEREQDRRAHLDRPDGWLRVGDRNVDELLAAAAGGAFIPRPTEWTIGAPQADTARADRPA